MSYRKNFSYWVSGLVLSLLPALTGGVAYAGPCVSPGDSTLVGVVDQIAALSKPLGAIPSDCIEKKMLYGYDRDEAALACGVTREAANPALASDGGGKKRKWATLDERVPLYLGAMGMSILLANKDKSCIRGPMFSTHKVLHLAGTALVSGGVTMATESPAWGVLAGLVVMSAREIHKNHTRGMNSEWASLIYDWGGLLLGTELGEKFVLLPKKGGADFGFSKSANLL